VDDDADDGGDDDDDDGDFLIGDDDNDCLCTCAMYYVHCTLYLHVTKFSNISSSNEQITYSRIVEFWIWNCSLLVSVFDLCVSLALSNIISFHPNFMQCF